MAKYSVCYSDREGFDWCIVNEFDRPILHGVGDMPAMCDIVEGANRWRNHLAEQQAAPDLAAENARLRELLRPFADVADDWDFLAKSGRNFDATDVVPLRIEPYRAARDELAGGE